MEQETRKIYLPFSGFYYSIHESQFDIFLEEEALDFTTDDIDWRSTYSSYSRDYTNAIASLLGIELKFISLLSPKYYNFETDDIEATAKLSDLKVIFNKVDKTALINRIKERFTSCDGFRSFYPNTLEEWGDIEEWGVIQFETLLEVYLIQEFEEDWEFMHALDYMSHPSEHIELEEEMKVS